MEVKDLGEGSDEEGFAQAGDAFEEGVAADHEAEDGLADDVGMANDDFADFGFDGGVVGFEVCDEGFGVGGGLWVVVVMRSPSLANEYG